MIRQPLRNLLLLMIMAPGLAIAGGGPAEELEPPAGAAQPAPNPTTVAASERPSQADSESNPTVQAQTQRIASSNAPPAEGSQRFIQFYNSDKSAELLYERQGAEFGLNISRVTASFLFNEGRDNTLTGAILFDTDPEYFPGVDLAFGAKVIAGLLAIENADVIGLAASVEARYALRDGRFPLTLSGSLSYAPDVLTFGQSDRIFDWHIRAALPLTNDIEGFFGFRFLQFDTRPGDRELDDEVHIGIRWALDSKLAI